MKLGLVVRDEGQSTVGNWNSSRRRRNCESMILDFFFGVAATSSREQAARSYNE
jgi:hypothetical protein